MKSIKTLQTFMVVYGLMFILGFTIWGAFDIVHHDWKQVALDGFNVFAGLAFLTVGIMGKIEMAKEEGRREVAEKFSDRLESLAEKVRKNMALAQATELKVKAGTSLPVESEPHVGPHGEGCHCDEMPDELAEVLDDALKTIMGDMSTRKAAVDAAEEVMAGKPDDYKATAADAKKVSDLFHEKTGLYMDVKVNKEGKFDATIVDEPKKPAAPKKTKTVAKTKKK